MLFTRGARRYEMLQYVAACSAASNEVTGCLAATRIKRSSLPAPRVHDIFSTADLLSIADRLRARFFHDLLSRSLIVCVTAL